MSSPSNIKPSFSFMSMSRAEQKLDKYVDMDDGPMPLQQNIISMKKKLRTPSLYEAERESHVK